MLIGVAQEKASIWRSWKAKGHEPAPTRTRIWSGAARWRSSTTTTSTSGIPSGVGSDDLEDQAYAPWPIWLCLNGHEWAKQQLRKRGMGYEALDNDFRSCQDPRQLQRICDRLGPGAVKSFSWRWQRRLPSPFTAAYLRAGYVYDLAFRQLEVSDTRVLDQPQAGRVFFKGLIREHLDLGRPDQVALIFDRRWS